MHQAKMSWQVLLVVALGVAQVAVGRHGAEMNAKPDLMINVRDNNNTRIVSGRPALPGEFPYFVSLRLVNSNGAAFGCGGSLVARHWVLTTAGCTARRAYIVARIGVVNLHAPEAIQETREWYIYPTFNVNSNNRQANDISLIKLPRWTTYTSRTRPIRLQSRQSAFANYNNVLLRVAGMGATWTNGPMIDHLRWVYQRGVSNARCVLWFGGALVNNNAICAQYDTLMNQSFWGGDQGAPLVHVGNDGIPTLVGVASFHTVGLWGCHSGRPAVFIRPGAFHKWFTQVTGIDFNSPVHEPETTLPPPTTTEAITTTLEVPSSTQVPEKTTTAPEIVTEIPEYTTKVPEITKIPEASSEEYEVGIEIPEYTTRVPDFTKIPDASPEDLEITNVVPEYTTKVPNSTKVPTASSEEADVGTKVPEYTTKLPDSTHVPGGTTEVVAISTSKSPDVTTQYPDTPAQCRCIPKRKYKNTYSKINNK